MQEELDEREAAMEKLVVEDVEFEEDRMEVFQLVVNPHQFSMSWVSTFQVQGGCRY